jgi:hypothetical protein
VSRGTCFEDVLWLFLHGRNLLWGARNAPRFRLKKKKRKKKKKKKNPQPSPPPTN